MSRYETHRGTLLNVPFTGRDSLLSNPTFQHEAESELDLVRIASRHWSTSLIVCRLSFVLP
jgi:hypothetical protein